MKQISESEDEFLVESDRVEEELTASFPLTAVIWNVTGRLTEVFKGISSQELAMLAGEKTARVFGLDLERLELIAYPVGAQKPEFNDPRQAVGHIASAAASRSGTTPG